MPEATLQAAPHENVAGELQTTAPAEAAAVSEQEPEPRTDEEAAKFLECSRMVVRFLTKRNILKPRNAKLRLRSGRRHFHSDLVPVKACLETTRLLTANRQASPLNKKLFVIEQISQNGDEKKYSVVDLCKKYPSSGDIFTVDGWCEKFVDKAKKEAKKANRAIDDRKEKIVLRSRLRKAIKNGILLNKMSEAIDVPQDQLREKSVLNDKLLGELSKKLGVAKKRLKRAAGTPSLMPIRIYGPVKYVLLECDLSQFMKETKISTCIDGEKRKSRAELTKIVAEIDTPGRPAVPDLRRAVSKCFSVWDELGLLATVTIRQESLSNLWGRPRNDACELAVEDKYVGLWTRNLKEYADELRILIEAAGPTGMDIAEVNAKLKNEELRAGLPKGIVGWQRTEVLRLAGVDRKRNLSGKPFAYFIKYKKGPAPKPERRKRGAASEFLKNEFAKGAVLIVEMRRKFPSETNTPRRGMRGVLERAAASLGCKKTSFQDKPRVAGKIQGRSWYFWYLPEAGQPTDEEMKSAVLDHLKNLEQERGGSSKYPGHTKKPYRTGRPPDDAREAMLEFCYDEYIAKKQSATTVIADAAAHQHAKYAPRDKHQLRDFVSQWAGKFEPALGTDRKPAAGEAVKS